MTDASVAVEHRSPGQQIRSAREAMGLHIVALAAALKVPVRKLEALEADRWAELTDPTFTRALASSVARHLKLDPAGVLSGLPTTQADKLDIPAGLGQAATTGGGRLRWQPTPVVWGSVGLLVLAVGVYLVPADWVAWPAGQAVTATQSRDPTKVTDPVGTPMGSAGSGLENASPALPSANALSEGASATVAQPPAPEPPAKAAQTPQVAAQQTAQGTAVAVKDPATVSATRLQLNLKGSSWVEVTDSTGKLRLQRIANAGETLSFDDAQAYAVVLGNAVAVDVVVNGQAKDMADATRNNVARFQAQ